MMLARSLDAAVLFNNILTPLYDLMLWIKCSNAQKTISFLGLS